MGSSISSRKPAVGRSIAAWRPALGIAALLFGLNSQAAHAQVLVRDNDANQTLSSINKTLGNIKTDTGNIQSNTKQTADNTKQTDTDLNSNMSVGSSSSPGDRVADPNQYPFAASTTLQQDLQQCGKLAPAQQSICQEIANTEDAQYQYMVTMYTTTKTRDQRLRAILQERNNIGGSDLGKLESNTNELVALYALMALDRQQMESANYAYATRLRYLRNQLTELANAAATGTPVNSGPSISLPGVGDIPVGSIVGALTTGVALKAALVGVQSPTPPGMQTLGSEKSNGW